MQQFARIWSGLSPQRRIVALAATAGVFAAVLILARMASTPNMAMLYAGLESGPAGEVVRALEQRGVAYDVRGGAIFVDGARRDELRMTLAAEGLPANSSKGYELLDSLSGFGTTSQMFDAAYWRAKEGELARTITASPGISAARVHIATTGSNPFQRDVRPTASVAVTAPGGAISPVQARALKYLVASAVAGLMPEDVAIIDGQGGLIAGSDDLARTPDAEDKASAMRERVLRLIEAQVGVGNAVVEVSVETQTDRESIRERRFDPDSRVAISTETEERTNSSRDSAGGEVTVASNLPDGDGAGGDQRTNENSESRERVNYEVAQTEREVIRAPGAIKRLSVAVLVNGLPSADGSKVEPLPEVQLADLRDLVASAVGYDEARGDMITIKSLPFQPAPPLPAPTDPPLISGLHLDLMQVIQIAILALVALVLALFVIRPILSRPPQEALALPARAADRDGPAPEAAGNPAQAEALPALTGEVDDGTGEFQSLPARASHQGGGQLSADPVDRLRDMIGERQEETVEILRSWLDEKEERA